MSFIFSIFIFLLFIGIFIMIAVLGFLRSLLGFGKRKPPIEDQDFQQYEQPASKPKIFNDKEGEYVDYEEVKEDK